MDGLAPEEGSYQGVVASQELLGVVYGAFTTYGTTLPLVADTWGSLIVQIQDINLRDLYPSGLLLSSHVRSGKARALYVVIVTYRDRNQTCMAPGSRFAQVW